MTGLSKEKIINNKIKAIISEILFIDENELIEDSFDEIKDLDSLAFSILLSKIETDFAITFEPENFTELTSISSLASYISSKQ